ncbi:MAG: hypothetical protein GAK40_00043 [Burkholderia plantarii]|nr:MAG: hypothetical protein GAK40_00043 [Burkholderia plantarii]
MAPLAGGSRSRHGKMRGSVRPSSRRHDDTPVCRLRRSAFPALSAVSRLSARGRRGHRGHPRRGPRDVARGRLAAAFARGGRAGRALRGAARAAARGRRRRAGRVPLAHRARSARDRVQLRLRTADGRASRRIDCPVPARLRARARLAVAAQQPRDRDPGERQRSGRGAAPARAGRRGESRRRAGLDQPGRLVSRALRSRALAAGRRACARTGARQRARAEQRGLRTEGGAALGRCAALCRARGRAGAGRSDLSLQSRDHPACARRFRPRPRGPRNALARLVRAAPRAREPAHAALAGRIARGPHAARVGRAGRGRSAAVQPRDSVTGRARARRRRPARLEFVPANGGAALAQPRCARRSLRHHDRLGEAARRRFPSAACERALAARPARRGDGRPGTVPACGCPGTRRVARALRGG